MRAVTALTPSLERTADLHSRGSTWGGRNDAVRHTGRCMSVAILFRVGLGTLLGGLGRGALLGPVHAVAASPQQSPLP
jgi:hypothetical protein